MLKNKDGGNNLLDVFSPTEEVISQYKPLPQDILDMNESDTACQYCGISYLILSKYSKMEQYLKQQEKELQNLKVHIYFK